MRSRIRSYVIVAAALTVLSALAATPADAGWWPTPAWARGSQARSMPAQIAAGLAAGAAARASASGPCGAGQVAVNSKAGLFCRHQVSDAPFPALPPTVVAAAAVQPRCYGNGVNGPRVHLVYGYVEGQPNRAGTLVPRILKEWVPAMEGNFRSASKEQGREIGVRYHAPGCKLVVDVIELPRDVNEAETFDEQTGIILDSLISEGYVGADNKPLLWLDAASAPATIGGGGAFCGVATQSIARFLPVTGDNPTPVNANDVGNLDAVPAVAIAFRNPSRAQDTQLRGRSRCWDGFTETHELLHTLGAVQFSAPHSDGGAHCSDGNDIMCDPNQVKVVSRCQSRIPLLDCGMDDYFAISPATGSYLSTHWNIANSRYLGDAIGIDAIPMVLPPI